MLVTAHPTTRKIKLQINLASSQPASARLTLVYPLIVFKWLIFGCLREVCILFSQSELHVLLAVASYCIILTVVMSLITVKAKFTLEQATKAQRGSTGVAVLFP
jgi:hypothetical protein